MYEIDSNFRLIVSFVNIIIFCGAYVVPLSIQYGSNEYVVGITKLN